MLDSDQKLAVREQIDKRLGSYAKIFGVANLLVLVSAALAFYVKLNDWQSEAIEEVKNNTAEVAIADAEDRLEGLFTKYEDKVDSIESSLDDVDKRSNDANLRAAELIGRMQENERAVTGAQDRYERLISNLGVLSDEGKIDSARAFVDTFQASSDIQGVAKDIIENKKTLETLRPLLDGRTLFSKQDEAVTLSTQTWIDIPGTEIRFNLDNNKTAVMQAFGSVRGLLSTTDAVNGKTAHCGFRFVVDGKSFGHKGWGEQIVGCGVSSTDTGGWWCSWNVMRLTELERGAHSINLQMTGWGDGKGAACVLEKEDYSAARLFVDLQ